MSSAGVDPKLAKLLDELRTWPGVTELVARYPQTWVYPGHVPHGIFVVFSGNVVLEWEEMAPGEADLYRSTPSQAIALPPPDELSDPAGCSVRVTLRTRALYVPRSLTSQHFDVAGRLSHPSLRVVSIARR